MQRIKLFSDSTCDLPQAEITAMDVDIIPLLITIKDVEYLDGVTIDSNLLFQKVAETKSLPQTASPSVQTYYEAFQPYVEKGIPVLYIGLSSKLSSSYEHAKLAAEMFPAGMVAVIDSLNLCGGIGALVRMAYRFQQEGKSLPEIVTLLEQIAPHYKLFFTMDSLKYLRKGGRCTLGQLIASNTLNIKPIIQMSKDGLSVWKKARGKKNALKLMLDEIERDKEKILFDEIHVATIYGDYAERNQLKADLQERTGITVYHEYDIGCVIASHCGEGTIGFGYFLKDSLF